MQEEIKQHVREILDLAFDVMDKTEAVVSLNVSNYGPLAHIYIMNDGFDSEKGFDGTYYIGMGRHPEKEFQEAKGHLESLLNKKEGGSNETREESKD